VYPNANTDEKLLEAYGFRKLSLYWSGDLTEKEADELRPKLKVSDPCRARSEQRKLMLQKCSGFSCSCICFSPQFSEQGNIELCRVMTRKDWAAGWPPGYIEPDLKEEGAGKLKLSWTQWLLRLVGLHAEKKKPELEPDPTLDPNWQPEYC
jgi:hypothetical protein